MAYLTSAEAQSRLSSRYGLTVALLAAHVEMAHDALSAGRPFIGAPYVYTQPDDFPRNVTLKGDTEGVVPTVVLDYVALYAAFVSQYDQITPLSSQQKGIGDLRKSESYARPKLSQIEAYLRAASMRLARYQLTTGELV